MSIVFRTSSANYTTGTGVNAQVFNRPTGVLDRDLILVLLIVEDTGTAPTITMPVGWTMVPGAEIVNGVYTSRVYYKVADGEPANYTINFTGSPNVTVAYISHYSDDGHDLAPEAVSVRTNGVSSTDIIWNGLTNATIAMVQYFARRSANMSIGTLNGATERLEASNPHYPYIAEQVQLPSAASKTVSGLVSATSDAISVAIVETGDPHPVQVRATATSASSSTAATTKSLTKPGSVTEDDLLLLQVSLYGIRTVTPPSGFTLVHEVIGPVSSMYLFEKRATASEPASYVVTYDTAVASMTGLVALYSPTTELVSVVASEESVSDPAPPDRVAPSVVNPGTTGRLLCFVGCQDNQISTPQTGMTELWDVGSTNATRIFLMEQMIWEPGATGERTATGTDTVALNVSAIVAPPLPPPDAPTGFAATATSSSTISLTWTDASLIEEGFRIERSSDGLTGWTEIETTAADVESFVDTLLTEDTTYYYRIFAFNAGGDSAASDVESATTWLEADPYSPGWLERSEEMYVYFHVPEVIFEAQVNLAGAPVYPLTALPFDNVTIGAYTDITPDMFYIVGSAAGLDDRGRGRIRYLATATDLDIPRTPQGTNDGELDVQDGDWIQVFEDYRVFPKRPFIDVDGTMYKDSVEDVSGLIMRFYPNPAGELVEGNRNEVLTPSTNVGPGAAGTVDPVTGYLRVQLPGAGAFSYATADGATIASYAWDIVDGILVEGSLTSPVLVADFPPGFRWIKLTAVDSNGIPFTARCPVKAVDPDDDDTFKEFQVSFQRTPQGTAVALNIFSDLPRATYPDGMLVMIWDRNMAAPDDRSNIMFIGWHERDSFDIRAEQNGTLRNTTLNCIDTAGKLSLTPGYPQLIEDELLRDEELEPTTTWAYMESPTVDKFTYQLIFYHSTITVLADLYWSGTGASYPFVSLQAPGGNLFSQFDNLARMLVPDHRLVCNAQGQLRVLPDPMLQNVADRSAEVVATLTEGDWMELRGAYQRGPKVGALWGRAKLTATEYVVVGDDEVITMVQSVAPGPSFGLGLGEATHMEQLAQSQEDLNEVTGHRYARQNARYEPLPITLDAEVARNIDPAEMSWVMLEVSAETAAQRGFASTSVRGLIQTLTMTYNVSEDGMTIDAQASFEIETSGPAAVTYAPEWE